MSEVVKNRSEIVFLYDVTNANPNGDPDENKPRMDDVTEINLVSDVRLKRTVRDYLKFKSMQFPDLKGYDVLVFPERKEDGKLKTKGEKIRDFLKFCPDGDAELKKSKNTAKLQACLNKEYIDLRLFGATLALGEEAETQDEESDSQQIAEEEPPVKKSQKKNPGTSIPPMKWIGPVQFKFGHSLHKVEPVLLKGTTVDSSGVGKATGTFTEFWYVPYSLISFSGIVNEVNAENTGLTDSDVEKLLDALWNGTKGLITRSKVGQIPRLLMQVVYKGHFHIGNLDNTISITDRDGNRIELSDDRGKSLRSISEIKIDLTNTLACISGDIDRIERINVAADRLTLFLVDGKEVRGDKLAEEIRKKLEGKVIVSPLFF